MLDVDALAQEIRRVDGSNSLGAGALAEALMPFFSAAAIPPGWPDPLESPQAEAIRNGKLDDTEIRNLFDQMERELRLHRERAAATGEARPVAWRPVIDFEGRYEVSSSGDVRSVKSGRVLAKPLAGDGYQKAELWKDNVRTQTYVHRVVARAFLGEPSEPKTEINHKDGNKLNNAVTNLEWVTRSQNVRHAMYELGANIRPIIAVDVETSEVMRFPSASEAARQGYDDGNVWNCLNGRKKTYKNKKWFYESDYAAPVPPVVGEDSPYPWKSVRQVPGTSVVNGSTMLLDAEGACIGLVTVLNADDNIRVEIARALDTAGDIAKTRRNIIAARHGEEEANARAEAAEAALAAASPTGAVKDVEALAEFLCSEFDFDLNPVVGAHWPEHPNDDGYRDGGYVKLQPTDVQAHARDNAKRILTFLGQRAALASSVAKPCGVKDDSLNESNGVE